MKRLTTVSCRSRGKIFSYFFRFRSLFNSRGLDDVEGLPLLSAARKGEGCMKDTDHHPPSPSRSPWRASKCPKEEKLRTTEWGKWPRNGTVLGWSDPTFAHGSAPKIVVGRSSPSRKRKGVLCACPATAVPQDRRNYFSVGDILVSHRAEQANRGQTSFFSEAQMVDHADHKLIHHTLRRTELGSVDADFLYRIGAAPSFLRALLNSRGEERFTPVLHGALHRSLHRGAARKASQINTINVPKTVALQAGWNDMKAGATPPFDARCVTVAVWSLPPSQELRGRVLRGCIHRPENLSDKRSDILYENERRSPLSILKSPPKQPKAVTIQARVEESVKTQLELYAEFIDASPSYVITEALKLLFRKDDDFRRWADQHANNHNNEKSQRRRSCEGRLTNMKSRPTQFGVRENTASSRQHASRRVVSPSILLLRSAVWN